MSDREYHCYGGFMWPKTPRNKSSYEEQACRDVLTLAEYLKAIRKLKNPNKKIISRMTETALKQVFCDLAATKSWEEDIKELTTKDASAHDLAIFKKVRKETRR